MRLFIALLALCGFTAHASSIESRLYEATAKVHVLQTETINTGTAFAVQTRRGVMYMTNRHVCGIGTLAVLIFPKTRVKAVIVRADITSDLCLLRADINLKGLKFSKVPPKIGDKVYSYGFAAGEFPVQQHGKVGPKGSVVVTMADKPPCPSPEVAQIDPSTGQIVCTAFFRVQLTTLRVTGGMSGSAVVNIKGEVVGVVQLTNGPFDTSGMVLWENIKKFLEQK